jgi:hypothetical protein
MKLNRLRANYLFSNKQFKFLIIKAKYHVVEPHYMNGSTPDQLANFVIEPECERR